MPGYTSEQIQEARIELARRDPNSWMEFAFHDKQGVPFRQGAIHRELQGAITKHKHVMIELPRFHGKSSQAVGRAIWELGHDRDLNITIVCANDDKARKRLGEIAFHIERNPAVQQVFPGFEAESCSKTKLLLRRDRIARDNSVEAYGVLSSGTGDRSDLVIYDDICDRRNSLTQPAMRRQVAQAYDEDWMQLVDEHTGRTWYLFTPWHNEDKSHELMAHGELPFVQHRVKVDWTSAGEPRRIDPVWKEYWGARELHARWKKIKTRPFQRAFCGKAVDDTERTVWPEWFRFGPPPFPLHTATRVQIWDGAAPRKTSTRNPDWMAYIDMYVSALAGQVYFADAWRARGLAPSRQVAAVASRLNLGPQPRYLVIEQVGESALASLVAESGIVQDGTILQPIGTEGKRKEVRAAEYLAPLMEGKHVVWAEKFNPKYNPEALPVMSELIDLPFGDHDDLADCAVYGARVAKRLVRFGVPEVGSVPTVRAEVNIY